MGPNPLLSASAPKPIRLGVAAAQQLMITILDNSTSNKGICSIPDVDVELHVEDDASP